MLRIPNCLKSRLSCELQCHKNKAKEISELVPEAKIVFAHGRMNKNEFKDADIIDIGACSTRPGSTPIDKNLEKKNLETGIKLIRNKKIIPLLRGGLFL